MDIKKFSRKPFDVEGVQVTPENLMDVADWCVGQFFSVDDEGKPDQFIKVAVRYPLNEKQTRAYPGDWVLKTKRGFKVYTDKAFRKDFIQDETPQDSAPVQLNNVFLQSADSPQIQDHSHAVRPSDAISGMSETDRFSDPRHRL